MHTYCMAPLAGTSSCLIRRFCASCARADHEPVWGAWMHLHMQQLPDQAFLCVSLRARRS